MSLLKKMGKSIKTWARGSPPLDDVVFKHIHKEFRVLLYASCVFMDLREGNWIFSVLTITLFNIVSWGYLILFSILGYILKDDFVEASHNWHMAALYLLALTALFYSNYNRGSFARLLTAWSRNFYDYEDDYKIEEMEEDIRGAKRTKMIILVAVPTYLAATGAVCMLGRTMDQYFGVATEETYVGSVYMKTPMPMWYPFTVDTYFKSVAVTVSQIMGAISVTSIIAGADAAMIFINQALALELKRIIYRVRKIQQCAYELHRKNGGRGLKTSQMFEDESYLKCYNLCLRKIAQHHAVVIENFKCIQSIVLWPAGAAVLIGSIAIAMSLFAFVLGGGKPSVTSFVVLLLGAETLNMAMICAMSEQVASLGESLHEELYDLNWMDANIQAKRTMMIMIERSKQPLILVGGLSPLNWETFSTIMNTAYSYLNLLLAAKDV